ncbi:uncharacterized protein LOC128546473 [Mercenaria mercenaria]|uniref:uncharacterized protein LOC128546473 n=1 Tax=Mercenaria mercenaria TaxID=6596 RepID=UPI00234E4AB0|nr:uncharacterized protein LOC128546473 [Mercenaria mercenaria]
MNLQKLISTREGQRRVVQRKLDSITDDMSPLEFMSLIDYLTEKAEIIKRLNEKIKLRDTSRKHSQDFTNNSSVDNEENPALPRHAGSSTFFQHRLPKLTLPTFDGDLTTWQTFWDSFESSVHLNASLSDVQKFNYLKSLLQGTASRCIDGFPLTNTNYSKAVSLLRERFGKSQKIIYTYMQSLLELVKPDNSVVSLQCFYDKMETFIRGLESLGQSQESYGSLLVPIVLEKLPGEIKRNMAREYGSQSWNLQDLRLSLSKEISFLEAGETMEVSEAHNPTALFFAGTRPKPKQPSHRHRNDHYKKNDKKQSSLNPDAASFTVPATSDVVSQPDTATLHSTIDSRPDILLKTAVAQVCTSSVSIETNILFDEGAQRSFITEVLAEKLHLPQTGSEVVHLASFGDTSQRVRNMTKGTISLITDDKEKIDIEVLIVPKIAVPLRSVNQNISSLPYLRGLKLAHPVTNDKEFETSLLIGADSYWKIVQDRVFRGNGPTAVQSRIGYLLSGPLPVSTYKQLPVSVQGRPTHHMLNVLKSPTDPCDLERFWRLESLGISENEENKSTTTYQEDYLRDSISYSNGHYSAKLPWKDDHETLPTNYDITRKRTENVIKRLGQDPQILQKYGDIIKDQETRGFIEKVDETIVPQHQIHYIPHHGVKKDSVTTPIRIVYDCSCRQPSLNDCLKSTPLELNGITHNLMRFRLHKYAVSSDIEKAFLQIQLAEEDRDVTRFIWLSDPNDPDSFEDGNQTLAYFQDARVLLSSANFNLRSWNSNSQRLRNLAATNDVLDTDNITKILGMRWNAETDMLMFQTTHIPIRAITTKREILRQTSRLYDPLGLLSPVTVRAKIMLQHIWQEKFDWDTQLPADIQHRWENLVNDLNIISTTKYRRCYFEIPAADEKSQKGADTLPLTLHVFVDTSQSSYGAAAYLCKGQQSSLIMSKNRVAPLKKLTLPRLELMAATVGARLANHIQKILQHTDVYFWSDSQIVLYWLETAKPLPRFVQNRVNEVKELTKNSKWKYCPTNSNPADLLTRGITAKQYAENESWLTVDQRPFKLAYMEYE